MDQNEYRDAIAKLGLTQVEAAKFLGVSERTGRRMAADAKSIPHAIAIALSLMIKFDISPKRALKIAKRDDWYE